MRCCTILILVSSSSTAMNENVMIQTWTSYSPAAAAAGAFPSLSPLLFSSLIITRKRERVLSVGDGTACVCVCIIHQEICSSRGHYLSNTNFKGIKKDKYLAVRQNVTKEPVRILSTSFPSFFFLFFYLRK